jgi:hypothetical protein
LRYRGINVWMRSSLFASNLYRSSRSQTIALLAALKHFIAVPGNPAAASHVKQPAQKSRLCSPRLC